MNTAPKRIIGIPMTAVSKNSRQTEVAIELDIVAIHKMLEQKFPNKKIKLKVYLPAETLPAAISTCSKVFSPETPLSKYTIYIVNNSKKKLDERSEDNFSAAKQKKPLAKSNAAKSAALPKLRQPESPKAQQVDFQYTAKLYEHHFTSPKTEINNWSASLNEHYNQIGLPSNVNEWNSKHYYHYIKNKYWEYYQMEMENVPMGLALAKIKSTLLNKFLDTHKKTKIEVKQFIDWVFQEKSSRVALNLGLIICDTMKNEWLQRQRKVVGTFTQNSIKLFQ